MGLLDAQEPTPLQDEPPKKPSQDCKGCTLTMSVPLPGRAPPNLTLLPTTRNRVGIGERVDLVCSVEVKSWSVSPTKAGSLKGNVNGDAKAGMFIAADVAGPVTVTADVGGCSCSIAFTVVAPSSFWMSILRPNAAKPPAVGNGLKHTHGQADVGFKTATAIEPKDVSFHQLQVRELNDPVTTTDAYFSKFNGQGHRDVEQGKQAGPSGPLLVNPATVQLGSVCRLVDGNYSGQVPPPLPTTTATWTAASRFEYQLKSDPFTGTAGPWTAFPTQQQQVVTVTPNGTTIMTKATAVGTATLDADDSDWFSG